MGSVQACVKLLKLLYCLEGDDPRDVSEGLVRKDPSKQTLHKLGIGLYTAISREQSGRLDSLQQLRFNVWHAYLGATWVIEVSLQKSFPFSLI